METRTAGSELELHCALLVSIEPELLPSVLLPVVLPLIEPAPDVPLEEPRLPEAEPVVDPDIEPEDEPELEGEELDEVVDGELELEDARLATERSEAARSDCERASAVRVPEVSGVVADDELPGDVAP